MLSCINTFEQSCRQAHKPCMFVRFGTALALRTRQVHHYTYAGLTYRMTSVSTRDDRLSRAVRQISRGGGRAPQKRNAGIMRVLNPDDGHPVNYRRSSAPQQATKRSRSTRTTETTRRCQSAATGEAEALRPKRTATPILQARPCRLRILIA